jgi:hypothetical protein
MIIAFTSDFQGRFAELNIAIQEDLADALALAARSMKALLLGQPS